jgi:NAD(P)-dependent dehydrogenase (short-subunit alcohol dehydrogenase family)
VVIDREKLSRLHDLSGRVAIVTGGTRGIGLAIAEGLVASGAKVAVASRKPDACAATEAHLRSLGGDAIGVPAHMGEVDAINRLVDRTVAEFGRLDIVVNNAANALTLPFGQLTTEAWDKSLGTNLRGPVFLVERALPHLETSGNAAILNVISAGAFLFSANTAMYAAAKAGLMAMTRAMAASFAPAGIRVNALAPGTVDTDMVRNNTPEVIESMSRASFLRRAAHPDEMVGPALLLCSDAGSFITGQVIIADGGLTPH